MQEPTQHCSMQELAGVRQQVLAAESKAADAVKEAAHLRQQLRSAQSKGQSQSAGADAAGLSRQTSSVLGQVMRETYEALKEEFQPDTVYKVCHAALTRLPYRSGHLLHIMWHAVDLISSLHLPQYLGVLVHCKKRCALRRFCQAFSSPFDYHLSKAFELCSTNHVCLMAFTDSHIF